MKKEPQLIQKSLTFFSLFSHYFFPRKSQHMLIVHSKLKRLDITPLVCTVEQIRLLRGLGGELMIIIMICVLFCEDFHIIMWGINGCWIYKLHIEFERILR